MNVCHIFWTVISGQIGRFSIRFPISRAGLGDVQRPNCSHNMRDVTAFVSPLSNHRCLTAPRTPREIIPSGHHSLSFPLHLAKNILKDIKRINIFNDQCSYKMKTHEQWPASTSSTTQQRNKCFSLLKWFSTLEFVQLFVYYTTSLHHHSRPTVVHPFVNEWLLAPTAFLLAVTFVAGLTSVLLDTVR